MNKNARVAPNLILRGFNPDPSILRVEDTYYCATSTFEWYPGVQIFKSSDLKSWELAARPLNEQRLLDMRGAPDSCGVWAPCLTYADNKFWLVYSSVRRFDGDYKDTPNFLTTADSINGPWSDPIYLNSSGFDGSMFHDDDGRKWLLNMVWDNRPDRTYFGGTLLQEYDHERGELIGPIKNIFKGTSLDGTEGPHIYKLEGKYYLVTAEGGTGYEHAVTVARADKIDGPYEVSPVHPLVTSVDQPNNLFQRTGHGSLVQSPEGKWYLACLASRPYSRERRNSMMGRESVLLPIARRDDGWFELDCELSEMLHDDSYAEQRSYNFASSSDLHEDFQWLRTPDTNRLFKLDKNAGGLVLTGRESIGSCFELALVARRQSTFNYEVETSVSFDPVSFQQAAGLTTYYNAHKFYFLHVTFDEDIGPVVGLMGCEGKLDLHAKYYIQDSLIKVPDGISNVGMKAVTKNGELNFFISFDEGASWQACGPTLDALVLSDEAGKGEGANFTGTFVGMAAYDLTGTGREAVFSYFTYEGSDAGHSETY